MSCPSKKSLKHKFIGYGGCQRTVSDFGVPFGYSVAAGKLTIYIKTFVTPLFLYAFYPYEYFS